ncbi:MAG: hypothetical protein IJU48_02630 [Synergistaceae bacterium]|nr:hypothetical protein [Synergistaceae bacterium]
MKISGQELLSELQRYKISYEVEDWHVRLSGGFDGAREYYEQFLHGNTDAEISLILELSKKDAELRYAIEERAAIRGSDGLPCDLYSAVKVCQR